VSWQRVRGHENLIESFAEVVQRDRLAHAYLFVGPPGVGKKLFAEELAKALLCERPADPLQACDQCSSCRLVEAGTHPDFLRASMPADKHEFPIDTMRELLAQIALKPARGSHKIATIDDADDLNDESANCFLKTLEEPPPNSVLILLATDLGRQLPTIVSRCQVVRFHPLSAATIAKLLVEQGVDASKPERLARLSGGSLGLARELADDELWSFRREMLAELAKPKPDTVELAKKLTAFCEDAGKETALQRARATLIVKLLVDLLEAALLISAGAEAANIEPDDRPAAEALARRFSADKLLHLIDRCLDAEFHIDRRVQLVLALEAFVDAFAEPIWA
jgi:DNA polymerase-3 subunit delta'